ncbi:predicted protein [Aspergillus terreus NIH2624]|uniref:Uncharacterized protein n=1 Tax=Aspergillus terreus (strain NIH 2624 / FGSC A1156) TaxID=341663 RepID=Q0CM07_ASPTN|nr:uncharacterized protein ATEG_05277 [Aspergillus terreus NIH2624]EAU34346.1 predicted protein [Aspergillus terreus NIH2624]
MPYNPGKCCQHCQSFNHQTRYCLRNKFCIYCKGFHNIVSCTKFRCRRCHTKGHHQDVCLDDPGPHVEWIPQPESHKKREPSKLNDSIKPHASGPTDIAASSKSHQKRKSSKHDSSMDPNISASADIAPSPESYKKRKQPKDHGFMYLNLTVPSPEHNDSKWLAIVQSVRDPPRQGSLEKHAGHDQCRADP